MIFECVDAQVDQFVHKTLDRENAFELFIGLMNDLQRRAFLPLSGLRTRAVCVRKLLGKSGAGGDGVSSDSTNERAFGFSAEL